ncbi:MAG: aldose epimerase [Hormoscilla sp. SP5CHS1]|nr:aldose epimerase [Hormoscilla sp. SP12CHS1]MBC6455113.1 aldose epimerase [Hormoscilla sp. SP5CHS1]
MYEIAVKHERYKTYILSDETALSRLEVVPERGGIVTRWQLQGQEIFYLDRERFANPSLTVRGGIPILFPICGNLPDNTYIHLGKEYTLKQHGFARELPWKVTDRVTNDLASLTLVLDSNSQTRTVYPFDFNVCFSYQLKGNSLEIKQRYENRSASLMPFSAGFHPYLLVDDKSQLDIDIPADQYQEKGSQEFHPFNGVFDFNQDEIDMAFRDLTSKSASVTDHSRQLQLTVTWDDTYSTLVFWTVKGKDFYCLEPWTGPRNALNTGENLLTLEPGAQMETFVRIAAKFL